VEEEERGGGGGMEEGKCVSCLQFHALPFNCERRFNFALVVASTAQGVSFPSLCIRMLLRSQRTEV
jgi:hypothetical protein